MDIMLYFRLPTYLNSLRQSRTALCLSYCSVHIVLSCILSYSITLLLHLNLYFENLTCYSFLIYNKFCFKMSFDISFNSCIASKVKCIISLLEVVCCLIDQEIIALPWDAKKTVIILNFLTLNNHAIWLISIAFLYIISPVLFIYFANLIISNLFNFSRHLSTLRVSKTSSFRNNSKVKFISKAVNSSYTT